MTPWQFGTVIQAMNADLQEEHRLRIWHAWHVAALSRARKLPSLKEMIAPPRKKGIDEADIKARMMAHNERLRRTNHG